MYFRRSAFLLSAALIFGLAPMQAHAAADLIPRKVIFGNPEKANPFISPDGKNIAYLAPVGGVLNVLVGPASDIAAAKPVTNEKSRPIRQFFWSPDAKRILYMQDEGGDENFHLFSVELSTGKIVDLTPYKGARADLIKMSYRHPDEILVGLNNRDPKWHDAWRINLQTGKGQLIEKNEGFAGYLADEDLNLLLAQKATPDGGMEAFKRDGKGWKTFFKIPGDDSLTTNPLEFSEDGKTLYMLESRGRDKSALTGLEMASGKSTVIAESANSDIAAILSDPQTNAVLAYTSEYERPIWSPIGATLKADIEHLNKQVPGVWDIVSQSRDNSLWTLRIDNVVEPVKFSLYDRKARALKTLFVGRPALTGKPLSPMFTPVLKSRDGMNLVSYLTLPKGADANGDGKPESPLPMVLNVHGGPWGRDSFGYDPEHQWLANRGYAVLSVNFRGSTGLGKGFTNAGDREWAAKMHDDLLDAVDWAVKESVAQKDKIAIYGGSYGGYATLVGLTFTPKTFACGVDIVGPSNLQTLLASIPPYWTSFLDNFKRRVGDPTTADGKKLLMDRSPLFKAASIERPLLIAQGANDPRVKQAEADQIVAAMKANKRPVTYALYADEGHGFARPENRLSFYAVSEAFLSQCLGGRFEPVGGDFKGSSISVSEGREHVPGLSQALNAVKP
jgi:dipeptidyl aminopeptidase/acylaminoacyl peptidase